MNNTTFAVAADVLTRLEITDTSKLKTMITDMKNCTLQMNDLKEQIKINRKKIKQMIKPFIRKVKVKKENRT